MARSNPPQPISQQLEFLKETITKRQKFVSQEHQAYGLELAKELHDWKNRSLYIRLAKTIDRQKLEKVRYFVKDHSPGQIRSRARLFMWKLKQIKEEKP